MSDMHLPAIEMACIQCAPADDALDVQACQVLCLSCSSLHAEGANQNAAQAAAASYCNNYTRPEGQNVGNHITGRPSSRVLAPPGGGSQIFFGNEEPQAEPAMMPKSPVHQVQPTSQKASPDLSS